VISARPGLLQGVATKKARKAGQICTVSTPQHGYITRAQLLDLGLSPSAISRRTDLFARHAGVYAVGHIDPTPIALAHAAVLACGSEAVLRFDSALALWGLGGWPDTPEVSSPTRRTRARIATYRQTGLGRDVTVNYGIRVTTVVRTIIDVAPRRSDRELVRLINDARLASQLKPTALQELLARCPRARRLIDPDQNPTRSRFEDDFMRWIRRHRLPVPEINRRNGRTEADAVFPEHKVIIELDTYGTHGDPVSFHADRARDRRNAANGNLTLRLTSDDLTDPEAARLRQILDARRRAA
jgi:very-short-patch-repair endonuclease